MAYLDDVSGRPVARGFAAAAGGRTKALAGVAAVHALMGWTLVSGLASRVVDAFVPESIVAKNVPVPVIDQPPPPPFVKLKPVPTVVKAPDVVIDEPSASERRALDPGPQPTPRVDDGLTGGLVIGPVEATKPPPSTPVFRPTVAGPNVGISTDDYPDASRRAGEEGAMRVRVSIGADGRVTGCEVTASTGFPRLDAKACQVAARRWRFQPATEDGRAVASSAERRVVWRLEAR